jgi:hypothetical protein
MTQYHYKISNAIGDSSPDPFSESSTQLFPLGTKLEYGDRIFRYAEVAGTAITAGKLVQTSATITDTDTADTPTTLVNHRDIVVQAVATAGATTVSVTLGATAVVANDYSEGYLHINDVAGQGQLRRIKSHPAANSGATLELTLYDKITTALTTSSKADLIYSNYKNIIVSPGSTAETGNIIGVTVIDMTAAYYGWIQTSGPCSVLTAGTLVLGENAVRSAGTDGAVAPATSDLLYSVGQVLVVNDSTDNSVIHLNIE